MKYQHGYTLIEWSIVIVLILPIMSVSLWGWVWNIEKIVGSDFGAITWLLVMRIIGVLLAPLGAVLGFL
jgi:hypothetical protein